MEFTGNIIGYSSSVVRSFLASLLTPTRAHHVLYDLVVDRLLLFVHRLGPLVADTPFHTMCNWIYPCHRLPRDAREPKMAH